MPRDPGVASLSNSGSTLTLASEGEARFTFTASDGRLEATQRIAATVLEPILEPSEAPQTESSRAPQLPPPQQQRELAIASTGTSVGVKSSNDGQSATLSMNLVPEDAEQTFLNHVMDPDNAGRFAYVMRMGSTRYISFVARASTGVASRPHSRGKVQVSRSRCGSPVDETGARFMPRRLRAAVVGTCNERPPRRFEQALTHLPDQWFRCRPFPVSRTRLTAVPSTTIARLWPMSTLLAVEPAASTRSLRPDCGRS